MPTPAERSALLFVAAVAALGLGVRGYRALSPASAPHPRDRAALAVQIAAVDSAIAAGGRRPARRARQSAHQPSRQSAPIAGPAAPADPPRSAREPIRLPPAGPIDPDRASAEELDRLPGIGPALAARIIAARDSAGPFGSLEGLQRVRGIGPALAAKIAPHVSFSGRPQPPPR